MFKLYYLSLLFLLNTVYTINFTSLQRQPFDNKYELHFNQRRDHSNEFTVRGIRADTKEYENLTINGKVIIKQSVILFTIPLSNECLDIFFTENQISMEIYNFNGNYSKEIYAPREKEDQFYLDHLNTVNSCTLRYCEIGAKFLIGLDNIDVVSNNMYRIDEVFYVGFERRPQYSDLILKIIPIFFPDSEERRDIYRIVFCPSEKWTSMYSLSQYILNENDTIGAIKFNQNFSQPILKLAHHDSKYFKKFIECGRLNQIFMPPINVGYEYHVYREEDILSKNEPIKPEEDLIITYNYSFICNKKNLSDPNYVVVGVLPPNNNYQSESNLVHVYRNYYKFYSGQKILIGTLNDLNSNIHNADKYLGLVSNILPECVVPNIKATLRLEINGVIQKYANDNNYVSEKAKTYIVDRRQVYEGTVGCHAIPDDMNYPPYDDFYEYRYKTILLMFDKNENKYVEVDELQVLISDTSYKCVLDVNRSSNSYDIDVLNYITETNFMIKINDSNIVDWIIFALCIYFIVILICIFFFCKCLYSTWKENRGINVCKESYNYFFRRNKKSPTVSTRTTSVSSKKKKKSTITKTENV